MNEVPTASDERIIDLETRLAEQDKSINELSDEVYRQQRQIEALEIEVRDLARRLLEVAAAEASTDPADEVPPHY